MNDTASPHPSPDTAASPSPDPAGGIAFVGGAYVPLAEATIPLMDRGFTRSDVTYDVVHVWKGAFFRLDAHVERFLASMARLRMSLPLSGDEMAAILHECVRRSTLRDAYVQLTCTRGVPPPGVRDPRLCENRFYAFAQPFVWIANEAQRREGLDMTVSSFQRIPPSSVDPRVKNFHWLDLTMAGFEAYDRGAAAAVLTDGAGNVTEGAGFNIFAVRDGALATPAAGVLEGVTRRTVIELAGEAGIACAQRALAIEELREADEVFIVSTAGGVMPVTRLDGRIYGNGRPGPVTGRIHDLYWQSHDEPRFRTPVDYSAPA